MTQFKALRYVQELYKRKSNLQVLKRHKELVYRKYIFRTTLLGSNYTKIDTIRRGATKIKNTHPDAIRRGATKIKNTYPEMN